MRGRKPSAVLANAAAMLNRQFLEQLARVTELVSPFAASLQGAFAARLQKLNFTREQQENLSAITSIAASNLVRSKGTLDEFLEQVEYRGRRLAKLGMSPAEVINALREYDGLLAVSLKTPLKEEWALIEWVHRQLHFLVVVTLNNAFYQVREAESHAFYELFRVEVESRSLEELLPRLLDVLVAYTGADAGQLYLQDAKSGHWNVAAASPHAAVAPLLGLRPALVSRLSTPYCEPIRPGKRGGSLDPSWPQLYKTLWSVPMAGQGPVRGVLQFAFEKEYAWLPREMELLMAAAERCWMAAEKAQLVQDLAHREEQVRQLAEHMVEVEESERKRISRELHDEAGQSLLCVRLQLEMLEQEAPDLAAPLRQRLSEARDLVEHTIVEIRRLIAALSPAILDQMGLAAALRQLVHRFRRLHPNTMVRISLPRKLELPKRVEIIVYRLIQEVFNNIGKYSLARNVNLSMDSADGVLRTHVEDDGVGFDVVAAFSRRDTFGLSGMRERVALLGGTLTVKSRRRSSEEPVLDEIVEPAPTVRRRGLAAEIHAAAGNGGKVKPKQGPIGVDRPGTAIWIELPLEARVRAGRRKTPSARKAAR